jgi:hypothetical protein
MKMSKIFRLASILMTFSLLISLSACFSQKQVETKPPEQANDSSLINDQKVLYFSGVTSQKLLMDDAFFVLSNLMQEPKPQDTNWTFQLNVQLTRIQRILNDEFGKICPVEYQDANIHYLKALESFRFVLENYPKALENLDTSLMEACSQELKIGSELLGTSVEELNK